MQNRLFPALIAAALSLSACTTLQKAPAATAQLVDSSGAARGTATFSPEAAGTRVQVRVSGLSAGMHGMHIHANPTCTNTTDAEGKVTVFGGAGGHFDPAGAGHHGSPESDNSQGHGGDLPMLMVNDDGTATASFLTAKISLSGANSVIGHSIIIHAASDDYHTDPSGNSGARERCGVIRGS